MLSLLLIFVSFSDIGQLFHLFGIVTFFSFSFCFWQQTATIWLWLCVSLFFLTIYLPRVVHPFAYDIENHIEGVHIKSHQEKQEIVIYILRFVINIYQSANKYPISGVCTRTGNNNIGQQSTQMKTNWIKEIRQNSHGKYKSLISFTNHSEDNCTEY